MTRWLKRLFSFCPHTQTTWPLWDAELEISKVTCTKCGAVFEYHTEPVWKRGKKLSPLVDLAERKV